MYLTSDMMHLGFPSEVTFILSDTSRVFPPASRQRGVSRYGSSEMPQQDLSFYTMLNKPVDQPAGTGPRQLRQEFPSSAT